METPPLYAGAKTFLPMFQEVGGPVWNSFDKFLEDCAGELVILSVEFQCIHETPAAEAAAPDQKIVIADKSVPYPLDLNDDGVPILPPNDNKTLDELKQIARSFLTLNYRNSPIYFQDTSLLSTVNLGHAAHNKHVAVPWTKVCKDADKFFDKEYLPAGVELQEISKMRGETLQSCYAHWYKRQEQGERAFIFRSVHAGDKRVPQDKKKRKARPAEGSDDEDVPDLRLSLEREDRPKYVMYFGSWIFSRLM
jgi:hypothetical protein